MSKTDKTIEITYDAFDRNDQPACKHEVVSEADLERTLERLYADGSVMNIRTRDAE